MRDRNPVTGCLTKSRTGSRLTVDDKIENWVVTFLVASKIVGKVDLLDRKIFEDKIKMDQPRIYPIKGNFESESFLFGIQDRHFLSFKNGVGPWSPERVETWTGPWISGEGWNYNLERFLCEKLIFPWLKSDSEPDSIPESPISLWYGVLSLTTGGIIGLSRGSSVFSLEFSAAGS